MSQKIELNNAAFEHAKQLIQAGKINLVHGIWHQSQPSSQDQNSFLANHPYTKYGQWFLGVVADTNPDTKEHYEFPFGNFRELFKSGLIAVEERARQHGHDVIADAAKELLELIKQHESH